MRFRQIFVTINMFMDHTASGGVIPQLNMASPAKHTELANPAAYASSGVVYPLITQAHDQKLEYAAQMQAQAEQKYGSPAGAIYNNRKLQDMTSGYAPPSTFNYNYATPGAGDQEDSSLFPGVSNGNLFLGGVFVICTVIVSVVFCRKRGSCGRGGHGSSSEFSDAHCGECRDYQARRAAEE